MPELKKFQTAGHGTNGERNPRASGPGFQSQTDETPEHLVEHAAKRTSDPFRKWAGVNLGPHAEWNHEQQRDENTGSEAIRVIGGTVVHVQSGTSYRDFARGFNRPDCFTFHHPQFRHYVRRVSKKSAKIAELIASCQGGGLDAHYLGFFECFNRGLYFEAHDVLEELWLPVRKQPEGDFYKGLIQLAGAFVHLQKKRPGPARALFLLSRSYLGKFPARHQHLNLSAVVELIATWLSRLDENADPLSQHTAPLLSLESPAS